MLLDDFSNVNANFFCKLVVFISLLHRLIVVAGKMLEPTFLWTRNATPENRYRPKPHWKASKIDLGWYDPYTSKLYMQLIFHIKAMPYVLNAGLSLLKGVLLNVGPLWLFQALKTFSSSRNTKTAKRGRLLKAKQLLSVIGNFELRQISFSKVPTMVPFTSVYPESP